MDDYTWNPDKNAWLINNRNISFNDAVFCIENGYLLERIPHPNQADYPDQEIFIIDINGYAFIVPFVDHGETIELKTVVPSRKMTKKYLEKGG